MTTTWSGWAQRTTLAVAMAALVATSCSGGGGSPSVGRSESTAVAVDGTTGATGATEPTPAGSTTPDTVVATSTTFPADGIGIADTVEPDAAALILDDTGLPVPGDQVLILVADGSGGTGDETAAAAAAAVGGDVVGRIELIGLWQIRIPATDLAGLDAAIAAAATVTGVVSAFANEVSVLDEEIWGTAVDAMDDPVYEGATGDGYRMIGVQQAWDALRGSGLEPAPVHVGIVDAGVWMGGGEFDGGVSVEEPSDGAGVNAAPDPGLDHGTGVAAIIGADGDDGGVAGIASVLPELQMTTTNAWAGKYGAGFSEVPFDPTDDAIVPWANGVAYTTGDFVAIAEQVRLGARVINMSFGNSNASTSSAAAYRLFFEQMAVRHPNVLFVGSAGNGGASLDGTHRYPSGLNLPNMITVGNVNNDGTKEQWSNTSSANFEVTLAAPGHQAVQGVDANGTIIDHTYVYSDGKTYGGGTSMAAPQVSAAAALVLAANPDLTAAEVKALLVATAQKTIVRADGTEQPVDAGLGAGVLSVDAAVAEAIRMQRMKLGLEPADLDVAELGDLGTVDAVAVSGAGDDWTVTAYVRACQGACTDVTIELQGEGTIAGSTSQHLDAAGEVSWSVTLPQRPVTLVVHRTDNGAGSRILVDALSIAGHWTGSYSLDYYTDPYGSSLHEPIPVYATMDVHLTVDGAGGVTAQLTYTLTVADGATAQSTGTGTISGTHFTLTWEGGLFDGTITSGADGTLAMAGTWSASSEGVSGGGSWTLTRTGD